MENENDFERWREEEQKYLQTMQHPVVDDVHALEREYVSTLKKLDTAQCVVIDTHQITTDVCFRLTYVDAAEAWRNLTPDDVRETSFAQQEERHTRAGEVEKLKQLRTRGLDTVLTLQQAARDIEGKLGIEQRWVPTDPAWIKASQSADELMLDHAIDTLEGLVVARLFELSKMHRAGVGE